MMYLDKIYTICIWDNCFLTSVMTTHTRCIKCTHWRGKGIILQHALTGYQVSFQSQSHIQNWDFFIPFNSQGHIGTGHQHYTCGTQTHRGDCLWLAAKLTNQLGHRRPRPFSRAIRTRSSSRYEIHREMRT